LVSARASLAAFSTRYCPSLLSALRLNSQLIGRALRHSAWPIHIKLSPIDLCYTITSCSLVVSC
jgi:hypothetical protein